MLPLRSTIPLFCVQRISGTRTMSSVAVLTPERFAEHRSGLKNQEITGKTAAGADLLLGLNDTEMLLRLKCFSPRLSLLAACSRLVFFSPPCSCASLRGRQAASLKMKPTSPPTWRPSLRCRRRGRQGRRRRSSRQRGGARSGPSKLLSSPRSDKGHAMSHNAIWY